MIVVLLTSEKEDAYRMKVLTQFANKKQIYWIGDKICFEESNLLSQQKNCWFVDLLTELIFIHVFLEFSYERQICLIATQFAYRRQICWMIADTIDKICSIADKICWQWISLPAQIDQQPYSNSWIMPIWVRLARNGLSLKVYGWDVPGSDLPRCSKTQAHSPLSLIQYNCFVADKGIPYTEQKNENENKNKSVFVFVKCTFTRPYTT